jgi:hypothetical protein
VGFGDVVTLFENLDSDAVTENTARYDYDGSGDAGFDDVVSLFEPSERAVVETGRLNAYSSRTVSWL